jgi:uncharacterized membrane protein (DUF441 family)
MPDGPVNPLWFIFMIAMLCIGALAPSRWIKIACAVVIVLTIFTMLGFLPPGGIR